jgi:hypothetical protein
MAATGTFSFPFTVIAHAPTTSGVAMLVVRSGQMVFLVPTNAAQRLEVSGIEIQNSPDVAAESGGQLPVTLDDGTTIKLVPFRIVTTEPPGGGEPPDVTIGRETGGERRAGPNRPRERGR